MGIRELNPRGQNVSFLESSFVVYLVSIEHKVIQMAIVEMGVPLVVDAKSGSNLGRHTPIASFWVHGE